MFKKIVGIGVMSVLTFANVGVLAANYPVSPYGIIQGGLPRVEIDWDSAAWSDMLSWKKQIPVGVGGGVLINPAYTSDWLVSVELHGQTLLQDRQKKVTQEKDVKGKEEQAPWTSSVVDPMAFLMGKVTMPISENRDWFGGFGLGGMWVNDKTCGIVVVDLGGNYHFNNGVYVRGSLRYVKPFIGEAANDKPATLLANVGTQIHLS